MPVVFTGTGNNNVRKCRGVLHTPNENNERNEGNGKAIRRIENE
jgi:hypothetical protein